MNLDCNFWITPHFLVQSTLLLFLHLLLLAFYFGSALIPFLILIFWFTLLCADSVYLNIHHVAARWLSKSSHLGQVFRVWVSVVFVCLKHV